jgi:hypothetical protein
MLDGFVRGGRKNLKSVPLVVSVLFFAYNGCSKEDKSGSTSGSATAQSTSGSTTSGGTGGQATMSTAATTSAGGAASSTGGATGTFGNATVTGGMSQAGQAGEGGNLDCTLDQLACDAECVDPRSEPLHCGDCDNACPAGIECRQA